MTKAQVVTRFKVACPDCSDTLAGSLFDEAHYQLCREVDVNDSSLVISLTQGDQTFALSATVKKAESVWYQPSSDESEWIRIEPTNLQELEITYPDWRQRTDEMVPALYYLGTKVTSGESTNIIGFINPVPEDTDTGYPNVTIYGQIITALSDGDDIPVIFDGYGQIYAYFMAMEFCALVAPQNVAYWANLYNAALQKLKTDIKSRQFGEEGFQIVPPIVAASSRRY